MSLPQYTEYRASGMNWLNHVPVHWSAVRLKTILCETDERAGERQAELLGLSKSLGVISRAQLEQGAAESDDYSKYKLVYPGQLVMNKMQAWNGVFGLSRNFGKVSPDYATFQFQKPEVSQYMSLLFRTDIMAGVFFTRCRGMGTAFLRINTGDFLDVKVPLPPLSEVQSIVAFLDSETGKIDTLIAEQEKLLTLVAEKRQATISHAVTRGLNPNVPMKDSGLPWLGEVPKHWEVKRLKHVSPKITVGIVVEPSKYYVENGVPALRSLNVRPGKVIADELVFISAQANDELCKSRLSEGDLVSVRTGQPGTTAVIPTELDGCNCIDLIIIRKPTDACEFFLCWFLSASAAIKQFEEGSGGAIQQHFNISMAANLTVPLPPLEEQREIVKFLDSETTKLDFLKSEAERAIALLKERRGALIAAAVTGKIDVRNAVPEELAA